MHCGAQPKGAVVCGEEGVRGAEEGVGRLEGINHKSINKVTLILARASAKGRAPFCVPGGLSVRVIVG